MATRGVNDAESPPRGYQEGRGLVPIPDPTLLTTELVDKAIDNLRKELQTRFDAMDTAADLLHEDYVRVPNQVDRAILNIRELMEGKINLISARVEEAMNVSNEKFASIGTQFIERDTRTEQTAAGVKIAVDAALQAAKEAVAEQNRSFALATGKSETATMKQIDALGLAIQTANKGLDDKIADMKDRLTRIEGMDLGSNRYREQQLGERADTHGGNQNMIAIAAAALATLAIVFTFMHSSPASSPVSMAPSSMLQRQSAPQFLPLPKFGLRVAGFEAPSRMISRTSTRNWLIRRSWSV
jgi:hypothetical protein